MAAVVAAMGGVDASAQDGGGVGVFELRIYHCVEGRLPALLARFREHTVIIFERHGMKSVAYWTPTDEPLKSNTLFYILKFPSREAATKSWKDFGQDAEWKRVQADSEKDGKIVERVESTFLELTDFSPKI